MAAECLPGVRSTDTCLPFGLSCTPWASTKVLKLVAALLRGLGVRLIVYIDDMLMIGKSPAETRDHVKALIVLLEGLGFIINREKSVLTPSQQIEFLGLRVDTSTMSLSLPGHKIRTIQGEAIQLLRQSSISARKVAQFIGKHNAAAQAVLPAPLFYRHLQRDLQEALARGNQSYESSLQLSQASREEIQWWQEHLTHWNGRTLLKHRQQLVIQSDASLTGWGLFAGEFGQGSMVSRGTEDAHQLLGTDCSHASSASFCQGSLRSVNSVAVRQSNSCGLHQPSGWHSIPATGTVGESFVALCSSAGHYAIGSTYSRGDQSGGRCRVQSDRGSPGLEAVTESFSEDQCYLGSSGGGSVCITPVLSAGPVLQLEAGSNGGSNRCFSTGLGPPEGLCQPSLVFDRESSQTSESPAGSGDSIYSGPSVEVSVMVSSSSGDALGLSSVDSSLSGSISHHLQLSGNEFSAPASRMAYLREKFASQNLSGTARDLLLASWRTKSNKTYDSHFNKWLCWCSARGSDPISGPVSEIANFLAHLHKEGYRSSSLNVFRSAISSVHDKVDGVDVGKHPTVTRLLKGAFHERPPLSRYTSTWDVNAVLLYLKSLGPTSDLTLKQLTYKLVMLLALTRPSRSADLSSLSLARRRFCPEGVTFLPATLAKQSRQGKPLVEFFSPCFPHDENLCPVRTLRQYESVTSPLRLEDQQGLFFGYC